MKEPRCLLLLALLVACARADSRPQTFVEEPAYQEVNPNGTAVMACKVSNKQGECRWTKDSNPLGSEKGKYEWAGDVNTGDCSIRIIDANLEYDDGVWLCQVTASSYKTKDALISKSAQLVVRESPTSIRMRNLNATNSSSLTLVSSGTSVELECVVEGGNPPAVLRWLIDGREAGEVAEAEVRPQNNTRLARVYQSTSSIVIAASGKLNGAQVACVAEHPALRDHINASTTLDVQYPPTVRIETSALDHLEDGKSKATLTCVSDANPPAEIVWAKEGLDGSFGTDKSIEFEPVSRHTAGVYSCRAKNSLGESKPAFVELDVKYSPSILAVGPSPSVETRLGDRTELTCEAEGNPPPKYTWLQTVTSTREVVVRGYDRLLVIANTSYAHQGEFVCKATNMLSSGDERSVQSEPIRVEVRGAPQVVRHFPGHVADEVRVQNGEDARLEVVFCADPLPSQQEWHLGDIGAGAGDNVVLAAGTGQGRFVAEAPRRAVGGHGDDCYVSTLRINGAHQNDGRTFVLRLVNDHGIDNHTVKLIVKDHVSQEVVIAIAVGCVLTLLVVVLVCVYCCKSSQAARALEQHKRKSPDLDSDKTDVESTHSSNLSGYPEKQQVIPPDALYASNEKRFVMAHELSAGSKESLSMRLNSSHVSHSSGELVPARPGSSSSPDHGHANANGHGVVPRAAVFNELCFPKTSNYGSMKKKHKQNAGVDCRLNYADGYGHYS